MSNGARGKKGRRHRHAGSESKKKAIRKRKLGRLMKKAATEFEEAEREER